MTIGKKIIVLILFTVLVVGLGAGGYLLYKNNNNTTEGTNMTVAEARGLITTVCEDLGWYTESETEQQSSNIGNGNISTLSMDYEDLDSSAGYESYRSSLFNENEDFVKVNFLIARIAFENSDLQEGVFYSSTASNYGTEYTMLLYFTISQNSVYISIKNANSDSRVDYVLTKDSEDSWTLNGYTNGLMSSESLIYGTDNTYLHYIIKSVSSEVVQYTENNVCFNAEIEDAGDIILTDILRLQIHDCNLSDYKRYRYTYYSYSGVGDSGITATEVVDSAKSTFTDWNLIDRIDFTNRAFIEKDFLEQLYIYLGYIEE